MRCDNVDGIHLALNLVQWRAYMDTAKIFQVLYNAVYFLTNKMTC
jgi:hypothetical protein